MPDKPMMECGHAANAITLLDGKSEPCCAICLHDPRSLRVATKAPDLTGRVARCSYGAHADVPSSASLAFFRHNPDAEFDRYYCGCYGWE